MGTDWNVTLGEKKPTEQEVRWILEDYFDGAAVVEKDPGSKKGAPCWHALLPGKASFPFKRLVPSLDHQNRDQRWIEVYLELDDDTLRVTTRQMDEYTNNLAEGIAKMFARYYGGKLEDNS